MKNERIEADYIKAKNLISEIVSLPVVYNTGDQIVSGVKDFASRPTISGSEIALNGDAIAYAIALG